MEKRDRKENNTKWKNRNPETGTDIKRADDPSAGADSGIPGTGEKDNVGNAASGATASGTKGRGSASFGNSGSGESD